MSRKKERGELMSSTNVSFSHPYLSHFTSDELSQISESTGYKKDQLMVQLLQYLIYLVNENRIRRDILNYYIQYLGLQSNYRWCGTLNLVIKTSSHEIVPNKIGEDDYFLDEFYSEGQQQQQYERWSDQSVSSGELITFDDYDLYKLSQFFHKNKSKFTQKRHNLFTVALTYKGRACHYVSFVYDKEQRILISFDPGVSLYTIGHSTIIPLIKKSFVLLKLIDPKHESFGSYDLGKCQETYCGTQYGLQFNGRFERERPADSFCQSWTVYFLYRYMLSQGDLSFLKDWCAIPPIDRECFVLTFFLIPTLLKFEKTKKIYMKDVMDEIDPRLSFNEVIHILSTFVERNMLHRFRKKEFTCPVKSIQY